MSQTKPPMPPGRDVRRPSGFGFGAWRQMVVRVFRNVATHHLSLISAGVGFWAMFALFPALAAVVGLYGFLADRAQILTMLDEVRPLMPAEAYALIETQARALIQVPQQRLGLTSGLALLIAIWSARLGVSAMMEGLGVVYREQDDRSLIGSYATSLALTLLVLGVVLLALIITVALPAVLQIVDFGPLAAWTAAAGPMLILAGATTFVIGALYRYGPNRKPARKRWVTWGAVGATLAWLVASLLLSLYVSSFSGFNKTYGTLGAAAGLMFWFYGSVFVVLLGAEFNAEMEMQTAHDTTTGPPRPMGDRGAFVADHVA